MMMQNINNFKIIANKQDDRIHSIYSEQFIIQTSLDMHIA
jgi:hypothetical protein